MFRINRYVDYLLPLLALGGFALAGCSDECDRASDCLRSEVCYIGTCTPAESASALCQSDSECNSGSTNNRRCIGGRCVVDPATAPQPCLVRPLCFDRGVITPIGTPTMTATTGVAVADRGAALGEVVAIRVQGGATVNVIATNQTTNRSMCVSLNVTSPGCDLIQVAVGDPFAPNATIYQSAMCTANLPTTVNNIEGQVTGTVQDCTNDSFTAEAEFNVAIQ